MLASFIEMPPKKQLIIAALHDLIASGSALSSVTVSQIAAKAGIGKGTIYEYFSCKEDIIKEAVIAVSITHLKNMFVILEKGDKYKDTQLKMADYILNIIQQNKVFLECMLKDFDDSKEICFCEIGHDFIDEYKDEIALLVNTLIQKGIEEGIIGSVPDKQKLEFAAFASLSYLVYSKPGKSGLFGSIYSEDEIKNISCDMFTKIIC